MTATKDGSGGNGQRNTPYWATGTSANHYAYTYTPNQTYYSASGVIFTPSAEDIEAGFTHLYSGYWYRTNPTVTGIKLIQSNIKAIEKRIAADQKDLDGLRAAEKLLNDNPEYSMLLDLHKRGLL